MEKIIYSCLVEPSDETYQNLLDYALVECKFFILITRREISKLKPSAEQVFDMLNPYLVKADKKSVWPGTILYRGEVTVYLYHFMTESNEILKRGANSLYQWLHPDLPEDLCFLRSDESPWFITVSHEDMSYFELSEDEWHRLQNNLPEFSATIKKTIWDYPL
jgi:hypothetical protein